MGRALRVSSALLLVLACAASVLGDASATPHAGFFTRVRWAVFGVPEETIVSDLGAKPADDLTACQAQLASATAGFSAAQQKIAELNQNIRDYDARYADCQGAVTDAKAQVLAERSLRETCEALRGNTTAVPGASSCPTTSVSGAPSSCVSDLVTCRTNLTNFMSAYSGALQKVNEISQNIKMYDQYLEQARGQLIDCRACASSHGVTC